MLIFYYGLLFLATLCISDGVATFLVLCLVDFLLLKAIWEDYKPFVSWRKKKYEQLIKLKKSVKKSFLKRWKKAPLLKRAYIIVAGVVGFALLILFTRLYLEVLWISWDDIGDDDKIRNLAIAFVGTITGIGALFGVYLAILRSEENKRQNEIAHKQAITAEQGLITDRISKAVEGLGKSESDFPVIEARLGALYALERIAKDSERDHIPIMELFCAYIRINSSNDNKDITKKPLREDIKIILAIIRRRHKWEQGKNRIETERTQKMSLHFFNCYLKSADLRGANLSGANFHKTNLQYAWLNHVNLSRARLINVDINYANLKGAKTAGAHARSGDFSGCPTLTQKQLDQMFLGKGVKLPKGLTHPQEDSKYDKKYNTEDDFMDAYREWLRETGY